MGFRDLITRIAGVCQIQYYNAVKQQDSIGLQSITNTCHLASSFNATAKRTLRGMIWGTM